MRIFDRYVVREVLLPFLLSLLLLTFLLLIPPVLQQGFPLIARGVDAWVVMRVVVTLLPQALGISIPMAVLLGLLVAFGRLSADREFVAMQSCGVSVYRLLRPVAFVALLATAATAYVMIVALPDSNQAFREIIFGEVAQHVENNIRPRVLFTEFPNHVLYVREMGDDHVMRDVFFTDTSKPGASTVYFAREGRVIVDRQNKLVQLQLAHGNQHTVKTADQDEYEGAQFESLSLSLDAQTVFRQSPAKGPQEMTIAELRKTIASAKPADRLAVDSRLMIQNKYSIPVACCVLALVALGLGVSNRKDGKLASFAIGFIVVFAYYVLLYMARAAAFGGVLNPDIAPWISAIVLGAFGVALLLWRARSTDRPMLINWSMSRASDGDPAADAGGTAVPPPPPMMGRAPRLRLPFVKLLDYYTTQQYVQVFGVAVLSALGIFYISTFIDLADKLFLRVGHDVDAAAVLLLPDSAVPLLHHSDCGAGRDARDDRRHDEEQRACRDEGLWHQSLPRCGPSPAHRRRRQRRAIWAAGVRDGRREPARRQARRHDPRLALAGAEHREPLDRQRVRRFLSLRSV